MDVIASVRHQHDILSRQAMMYLLTMGWFPAHTNLAMREREKLHYVHSASLADEDGSAFMSGPFAEWL